MFISSFQLFGPRPPPAQQPGPVVHQEGRNDEREVEDQWEHVEYTAEPPMSGGVVISAARPVPEGPEELNGSHRQPQSFHMQRIPHGSGHYSFKPATQPELPAIDTATAKEEIEGLRDEITAKYSEVLRKRTAIHDSFKAFKTSLGAPESSDLPACFKIIKSTAGLYSQLQVQDDPPRLMLDEESWSELPDKYKQAVQHFTAMLCSCHEFLDEKESSVQYIERRLRQIENPRHTRTRATTETFNKLKDIPQQIEEFAKEVDMLLHDVGVAENMIANVSGMTGMIAQLPVPQEL